MGTPRLGAPELTAGQATPETTVNEQIRYVEAGAGHFTFVDRDLSTPPGSPSDGDCYLVKATGTDDWTGHDGDIALFINTAWVFIEPKQGMTAYVNDEDVLIARAGSAWFVQGTIDQWDANFTADGEMTLYAHTAQTIDEIDTTGTGTAAYEKSTAAAPNTFSSATPPFAVEKNAKWKVSATAVSGNFAVHLKRTD